MSLPSQPSEPDLIQLHHHHDTLPHQTTAVLSKRIRAPVDVVWSFVRRFDAPQCYKPFVQRCTMHGEVKVGSLREVYVISGLPATMSTERLEILDEESHILSYSVIGGDHRLKNYRSITTLHSEEKDGEPATLVLESYTVDIPDGNTAEDTRFFVDTLIKRNLKSLTEICERSSR